MKKIIYCLSLFLVFARANGQSVDSLTVNYYENFPYAYSESGSLKGIEIDIVNEYVNWLKNKKNITVIVTYKAYSEFSNFYKSVKEGGAKTIGLGSVTNSSEREKEIIFSPPYLRNVAVLISSGSVPTVKNKNAIEVSKVFSGMNAFAVGGSSHISYLNAIKKNYLPTLNISTTSDQKKLLEGIISDQKTFGYVDIIAYWSFIKSYQGKYLKIQKAFNEPNEFLSFILPKKSVHAALVGEFFESGFGFTSTKTYYQLLEKYLGHEIIESVEIK
jgi:ABC-type amino acid transport substrate-binding protein